MSTARGFDPRRLDVAAFAADHGALTGAMPLSALPRLSADAVPQDDGQAAQVRWSAQGVQRALAGGGAETRLKLQAATSLQLLCQRCLQPVTVALDVQPRLRFVGDEALAEELDADSEDDVLALGAPLDLQALIEDELILALPLVPRHERCPQPLPWSPEASSADGVPESAEHPFAALAALRRDGGTSG